MVLFHVGDLRMALQAATTACCLVPITPPERLRASVAVVPSVNHLPRASFRVFSSNLRSTSFSSSASSGSGSRSSISFTSSGIQTCVPKDEKPDVCTADELHYVHVPGTEWRIALWRYIPCLKAPKRNHPLVLLSGVGTNAIGFDLSTEASFARHMAKEGFDTWVVEVRGAGLSSRIKSRSIEQHEKKYVASDLIEPSHSELQNEALSEPKMPIKVDNQQHTGVPNVNGNKAEASTLSDEIPFSKLNDSFLYLTEKLSDYLSESQLKVASEKFLERISKLLEEAGFSDRFNDIQEKITNVLEERQWSTASIQIRDLSNRLINILDEGQRSVSPQLLDMQMRLSATIEDFQKQVDLILTYDWDFDNYLEDDIPAALQYIKKNTQPKDGKLLAIGHSMGGILLYAMLSRSGYEGRESEFVAVSTLASSLDYTSSKSSLKLLLPLVDPAQALNVPVVPMGAIMAAVYPLASNPPYALSWLNAQVSAQEMMHPELFKKLVLKNFCTVPAKLLLQLATAFRDRGLCDRSGMFYYKDHINKCNVPVLALAGDQDLICPPEAVYETVELFPRHVATCKLFGNPGGPHYGHYDLVGSRMAINEVYPCIVEFLCRHDDICQ